jgi:hypothetical protein
MVCSTQSSYAPFYTGHSVCVDVDGHNVLSILQQAHESQQEQQMQFTYVAGRSTKQQDLFKGNTTIAIQRRTKAINQQRSHWY